MSCQKGSEEILTTSTKVDKESQETERMTSVTRWLYYLLDIWHLQHQ